MTGEEIAQSMRKCPTCNQPVEWNDNPNRPFCSERCRLVDLGRWVNEEYRVPAERADHREEPGAKSIPERDQDVPTD